MAARVLGSLSCACFVPLLLHQLYYLDQPDASQILPRFGLSSESSPGSFLLFDIIVFESGTTGSRTNQAASFPTQSATA